MNVKEITIFAEQIILFQASEVMLLILINIKSLTFEDCVLMVSANILTMQMKYGGQGFNSRLGRRTFFCRINALICHISDCLWDPTHCPTDSSELVFFFALFCFQIGPRVARSRDDVALLAPSSKGLLASSS